MRLDEVLSFDYDIFAHRKEGKCPETLKEHTELCCKYYKKLLEDKKLMPCFLEIWKQFLGESSADLEAFLTEILEAMIILHDVGKINPVFQRDAMKNPYHKIADFKCLNEGNHALLSAVVYMDYFYSRLRQEDFSRTVKTKLKGIISVHAYAIARHHGDMKTPNDFLMEFKDGKATAIIEWFDKNRQPLYKGPFFFSADNCALAAAAWTKAVKGNTRSDDIVMYFYMRLIYSLLVTCDYYATSEYMNGIEIMNFGNIADKELLNELFEKNDITVSIRRYEKEQYGTERDLSSETEINIMRSELFLDAEKTFQKNQNENLFFLEAPTGSGKSHTSMNLSFKTMSMGIDKIFYVYPFNTLIEQNMESLKKIFKSDKEVLSKVTVVNSLMPIKVNNKQNVESLDESDTETTEKYYQEALLDRQFLNYPFVLTTHVSLFNTLFGYNKESLFGFLQMSHSMIVLDEIQSYKNTLWSEIICFLKEMARIMKCKIIIMSATLPDLEYLTGETRQVVNLIENREKYFCHPKFKDRVNISYELLDGNIKEKISFEVLKQHIKMHMIHKNKILVEFIKKDSAYKFYEILCDDEKIDADVRLLTGDDNQLDREKILDEIKTAKDKSVILVATQVIEAGVDIDMDAGYKDVSKLDSEEQFMGRINRSCKRIGSVYFFDMDPAENIYRDDLRINQKFTLKNLTMREILNNKQFDQYYKPVLEALRVQVNEAANEEGLEDFFERKVRAMCFKEISDRMALIQDDKWHMSVYLSRRISLPDGTELDGRLCWEVYKDLLVNQSMDYAEKQIKLSEVRSKMANFIYQVKRNTDLAYSDYIGELYMIENGEEFFENGKLNKERLEKAGGLFLDL